jgi:hypothetical protein
MPGAAASVSRRRREHRSLLAGGGRRANRSHTLAASQAFERMHMFQIRVNTSASADAGTLSRRVDTLERTLIEAVLAR